MRNPVYASVCMYGWCAATLAVTVHVSCVCESFVLYIYSAQSQLQVSLDARLLRPMPDRHRAIQAHPPSQQGHSGLVLR